MLFELNVNIQYGIDNYIYMTQGFCFYQRKQVNSQRLQQHRVETILIIVQETKYYCSSSQNIIIIVI